MDKRQLDNIVGSPLIREVNEIHKQTDPLYQIKNSLEITETIKKMEHLNSAVSIAEAARKTLDQFSKLSTSFEQQRSIAKHVQLETEKLSSFRNLALKMADEVNAYKSIMPARDILIQSMGGISTYEDIQAAVNEAKDSLESFRSPINIAHNALKISEISSLVKELQSQTSFTNSLFSEYADAFKQLGSLRKLESFQAIFRLNDFQFEEVISTTLTQEDVTNFSEKPISKVESDLSDKNKLGKDFNLYVDEDKKYLSYIYHYYLLPFTFIIVSILIAPYIQQAQAELEILTNQQEVKAFTRSPPYTFDRQSLKGHRFTTVSLLNLRDNPSMNSNVIDSLPIGTVLRIINKSNRSWLLVEVEINGELEQGWVLRRYTTYFK